MKIKIGHLTVPVYALSRAQAEGQAAVGTYTRGHAEIWIDAHIRPEVQGETLLHEVLHAICEDRELDLGEAEERVASRIAKGLCAIIVDNPDFFKHVTDALTKKKSLKLPPHA